jgi:LemA protein
MRASRFRLGARGLGVLAAVWLSGCGYGALQSGDSKVEAAWSEVISQYQQRAALIPNLVDIVKGYAPGEQRALDGLIAAQARAGSIPASYKLINDPLLLAQFQAAQNELSQALARLLGISEKYPDLKSDQNFRDAEASLETSNERIATARRHYSDAARGYNLTIRSFPDRLTASVLGYKPKSEFAAPNEPAVPQPRDAAPAAPAPSPPPAAAPQEQTPPPEPAAPLPEQAPDATPPVSAPPSPEAGPSSSPEPDSGAPPRPAPSSAAPGPASAGQG